MSVSKSFILAGNATFTIETPDRGHRTYKTEYAPAKDGYPAGYFVSLLCGPDNVTFYKYLGKLDQFTSFVKTSYKSCRPADNYDVRLLNRVLARIWSDDHAAYEQHGYKTHHEGQCGRCGRKLTVPSSIESGIGPECAKMLAS